MLKSKGCEVKLRVSLLMVWETLTTAINILYLCHCGGVFLVYGIANILRDVAFFSTNYVNVF